MKVLRTENSHSDMFRSKANTSPSRVKKNRPHEFMKILEQTLSEQSDEPEEFRVLLPKHGHFWDNGYEDLG